VLKVNGVSESPKTRLRHSDDLEHSDGAAVVSAVVDLDDPDLDAVAADLAAVEAALAELEEGGPPGDEPAEPDPA
jgi:hypothetical protein